MASYYRIIRDFRRKGSECDLSEDEQLQRRAQTQTHFLLNSKGERVYMCCAQGECYHFDGCQENKCINISHWNILERGCSLISKKHNNLTQLHVVRESFDDIRDRQSKAFLDDCWFIVSRFNGARWSFPYYHNLGMETRCRGWWAWNVCFFTFCSHLFIGYELVCMYLHITNLFWCNLRIK